MMGRIEALRAQIAEGPGRLPVIGASEGVAVVLDEPQAMAGAEIAARLQIEGIAEGMGEHDRLGLAGRECLLQLLDARITRDRIVVDEDRDRSILHDRSYGGRESGRGCDHLVARSDPAILELRGAERGESQEVRRRSAVDQQAGADAEGGRELLFEAHPVRAQGEPEVEHAVDAGCDLLLVVHPARIWDHALPWIEPGLGAEPYEFTGPVQDLPPQARFLLGMVRHRCLRCAIGSWSRAILRDLRRPRRYGSAPE
jgi:hypothetical protein